MNIMPILFTNQIPGYNQIEEKASAFLSDDYPLTFQVEAGLIPGNHVFCPVVGVRLVVYIPTENWMKQISFWLDKNGEFACSGSDLGVKESDGRYAYKVLLRDLLKHIPSDMQRKIQVPKKKKAPHLYPFPSDFSIAGV